MDEEVMVVAARTAWGEYLRYAFYMCPAHYPLRAAPRVAFYFGAAIQRRVPLVLERADHVELSMDEQIQHVTLSRRILALLPAFIQANNARPPQDRIDGPIRALVLSVTKSEDTVDLGREIPNRLEG